MIKCFTTILLVGILFFGCTGVKIETTPTPIESIAIEPTKTIEPTAAQTIKPTMQPELDIKYSFIRKDRNRAEFSAVIIYGKVFAVYNTHEILGKIPSRENSAHLFEILDSNGGNHLFASNINNERIVDIYYSKIYWHETEKSDGCMDLYFRYEEEPVLKHIVDFLEVVDNKLIYETDDLKYHSFDLDTRDIVDLEDYADKRYYDYLKNNGEEFIKAFDVNRKWVDKTEKYLFIYEWEPNEIEIYEYEEKEENYLVHDEYETIKLPDYGEFKNVKAIGEKIYMVFENENTQVYSYVRLWVLSPSIRISSVMLPIISY